MLSVAKAYLERIGLAALTDWRVVHVFDRTQAGVPRTAPYEVSARWFEVEGKPSLFAFGPAAQTPFGLLSDAQKRHAGRILLEAYGGRQTALAEDIMHSDREMLRALSR